MSGRKLGLKFHKFSPIFSYGSVFGFCCSEFFCLHTLPSETDHVTFPRSCYDFARSWQDWDVFPRILPMLPRFSMYLAKASKTKLACQPY